MIRYRMVVSYDGTAYAGWQVQPGRPTIQAALEQALAQLSGAPARVHGSGRTDAGVHARRQCAHFDTRSKLDPSRLLRGLNALLDPDLRVIEIRRAAPGFHARYSARAKEYRYSLWDGPVCPPFLYRYRTCVAARLAEDSMRAAASRLAGKHDFSAFSANPGRDRDDPVRTLSELSIRRRGHDVCIRAVGDGFLYKMVRSLAGFLVRVGEGSLRPQEADAILAARRRTARVPTAPPQGLCLWRVYY